MSELTLERLQEVLYYHPETGDFYWLIGGHSRWPGNIAGFKGDRYCYLRVDNKTYPIHSLAFFYMTGRWPHYQMDHINRNGLDNRWVNLREATAAQNNDNRSYPVSKRGLPRGVDYEPRNKRYRGKIRLNNRSYRTPWFKTVEEAQSAYAELARIKRMLLWGETGTGGHG